MCRGKNVFDVVKTLLLLYPEAAGVQTQGGWTPLHYAVDRDIVDLNVIKILCATYPKGLSIQDGAHKLPLHWAIDRAMVDTDVIRFLVKLYPPAISASCYKQIVHADNHAEFGSWNAEALAVDRGHLEIARYLMMFNASNRKTRNKALFESLNWFSRCHLLLAVHVRSHEMKKFRYISSCKSSVEEIFLRYRRILTTVNIE